MNELKSFTHTVYGQIRVVMIDGEPWLVGRDVAAALGYTNTKKALADHVDEEDKRQGDGVTIRDPMGREQHPTVINESGLYSLVLSSKLPGAKAFRRWITSEVLPSIRRHGAYMTDAVVEAALLDPDMMIRLLTNLKEERARRRELEGTVEQQRAAIADFAPVRQYVDTILSSPGTLATTQVAADYNLSAYKLNKILAEERVQRKVNGQWILYKEHMGKGYTKSKTIPITRSDGTPDTKLETRWTQKGRLMIHELLKKRGIHAAMDLLAAKK